MLTSMFEALSLSTSTGTLRLLLSLYIVLSRRSKARRAVDECFLSKRSSRKSPLSSRKQAVHRDDMEPIPIRTTSFLIPAQLNSLIGLYSLLRDELRVRHVTAMHLRSGQPEVLET